ncbi:MAG TPA: efflux RND transporter periplasmic adaptor subunit [Bryobacteraceae bacterium]|jgi:RND family efflux transporter MFP subunit
MRSIKPTELKPGESESDEIELQARPQSRWHPSNHTIWAITLGVVVAIIIAFLGGYIPLAKRKALIAGEALERQEALPRVRVVQLTRAPRASEMELPGNIQAITEAPILARANGYIKRRMADIGDRVVAGQPLVEIEAPELDEQVRQAQAAREQARAGLEGALANLEQGKANMELARVTAQRYASLVTQGAVSRQENDVYQAQYHAQTASVNALEKAIAAQRSNVGAAEANLARLESMRSYRLVIAPFAGVITLRNVDVGALVTTGSTLLFRIAQMDTLRIYINVPQSNASFVRQGETATLRVSNLPGRIFTGAIARTANSLDPGSRTMLVEVHVANRDGALLPGMYAQVSLSNTRDHPPLLLPSDALVVRPEGTLVATVDSDHTVHLRKIQVGRDYGDRMEVVSGLQQGDTVIPSPGDLAREGLKVDPVPEDAK